MPEHSFPCSVPGRLRNADLFATATGIFTAGFAIFVVFVIVCAAIIAGATIVASVVVGAAIIASAIVIASVAAGATVVAGAIIIARLTGSTVDDRTLHRGGAWAVVTAPLIGVTDGVRLQPGGL